MIANNTMKVLHVGMEKESNNMLARIHADPIRRSSGTRFASGCR